MLTGLYTLTAFDAAIIVDSNLNFIGSNIRNISLYRAMPNTFIASLAFLLTSQNVTHSVYLPFDNILVM